MLLLFLIFRVVILSVFTFWVPCWGCPLRFPHKKRCSVPLCLQLFAGELVSYLQYISLLALSGVQHILCCVFALFVFVLCALCCGFLWIVHLLLPLRYSLTFILMQCLQEWYRKQKSENVNLGLLKTSFWLQVCCWVATRLLQIFVFRKG